MHKGWVRIDSEREAKFWQGKDRPEKYRYVEETDDEVHVSSAWVEYWEDIRDEVDEPEVDGLYEDADGDRWIRLSGKWLHQDNDFWAWEKWEDRLVSSVPVTLVDPSDY